MIAVYKYSSRSKPWDGEELFKLKFQEFSSRKKLTMNLIWKLEEVLSIRIRRCGVDFLKEQFKQTPPPQLFFLYRF